MPNPVIVPCPKDVWTPVATGVTTGAVYALVGRKLYQTYRLAGGAAPTDLSEAVDLVRPVDLVDSSALIDVYIYSKGEVGSVRVDVS